MAIRVTQTMMNTQLLRNISGNLGRMNTLQNQLATGRRINAPSDDPVGLTFAMRYRSEISANDQYIKNVDSASSMLDYSDMAMGQAGDVLQRLRELAVQGGSSSLPQEAYDSINLEVKELYKQMVEIGNSKFNGKYVFNGELTETPPYPKQGLGEPGSPTAYEVSTDTGQIKYELAPGVTLAANIIGNDVFGGAIGDDSSDNVFHVIRRISEALAAGNSNKVSDLIGKVDTRLNTLLEKRAEVGARTNRLSLVQDRLSSISVNLTSIQSKTEDADMSEVITNLKMDENVYQASLSAGAKLISPSLVDFLR
ncbi:flagellar hook-associated protein FlgL [Cohnella silvisoli]|uniref:Flagellar hook-associated protein FlgL n=1 Tax=Cohnella silvisoli TaxID=2873699 RepID=A0ABV1KQY9_9BACL|nr:flagellar hook-associated protein FlgL [Cohnella silvisoli]MCD9022305.1 flagellar hook-associated protein FlgL [Cohnella silvisoli]